jgi:tetratricopeptide (TPR) repeat protein
MSAPFTVFVCSTFDDLEQEREAVLDAIRRVQSRHNAMEFFGARPGRPIDVCLDEVCKSDLLVVIVGLKYGSLPPGMEVSYSQAEYEEGVRLGKPCLVYLRDEDVPILPKYVERDPDKLRLLDAWKQTLNAAHTVAKFENWPNLAVQVAADIGNVLLVRATAAARGVPEAPLREVLKRLGETEVAEAEIPDRLAKAADELIRLRADLTRLSNDRPEFAAIRACASALIDKGDFDAARAVLNEGRLRARALREEISRTEAAFLTDEARVDRLQLNYDAACAKFAAAARLDPNNAWLWIELGDLWEMRGSLTEAERAFSAARDAAARSGDDRDLSVSHNRIGDTQVAQGSLDAALKSFRDGLVMIDRLTKSDPGNTEWQRDLSVSYNKIGDVQVAQGDLAGALKSYRGSLAIADRLAQSDPGNAGWQRDMAISNSKVADVQVAQGDLAGALKSYRGSLAIADRLAQSDPGNVGWQRDLSVSYEKMGDVQVAHGDLAGALKSNRDSLAIRDRLAQSDPGNAGSQRDLSVSYNKVGNVQVAQGDLAGALASYREDLAIADRLAQSDPGNAGWRRDLSVSYNKIGNVKVAQGDLAGALKSFSDSLAIADRLAQSDPGNADWQRDLAVSHAKIANALKSMGRGGEALESLRQGHAIMVR